MDPSRRQITKIGREVNRFVHHMLKNIDIGSSEYEFIHAVRKNPGITQAGLRELLELDKGAAARRAASLEAKGYLRREANPLDHRSKLLYATEKAEMLKHSRAMLEASFYEWLLADLPEESRHNFVETLNTLYLKAKNESQSGFRLISEKVRYDE